MKNILCFGDSNTHGSNPSGGRWGIGERWTSVLQNLLGDEYRIIEEGCPCRTSLFTDDLEGSDVGKNSLPVCLLSHKPLDLVIIMLGTNDMKHRFALLPADIAIGSAKLAQMALKFDYGDDRVPKVLVISPIEIGEGIEFGINTGFTENAVEVSRKVAPYYKKYAEMFGAYYMNAAEFAKPSKIDMLHMDKEDHAKLAKAICDKIHEIL